MAGIIEPIPREFRRRCLAEAARANRPPFRGGAVDNLEQAPMGKGHGNYGKPFDVETACYLKPIFAAYDQARKTDTRLKLVLKAGVKTVKSFSLEVCTAEHVAYGNGDVALFFATGETADVGATTRILDFFRGIPSFARKLETMISRFDDTKGALKFPDKTLFILAANMSNTQQKNLGMVGLQDAFLTGTTGMIEEMIARTTQYEREAIIFLESQGGEKGYDFDRHYEDTNQQELQVLCPSCGTGHCFNWKAFDEQEMRRPETFVPIPPRAIPSLDQSAWINEHQPKLKNKIAGFQRGPEELIKFASGEYNEIAVLRETYFECFHCGGIWRDVPATREQLDRSAFYLPQRTDALPGHLGFNVPQWINRRLSWGKMMLEKLQAQRVANELGNFEPLKKWWQKVAARTWDNDINAKVAERPGATRYDLSPEHTRPGELVRISATDIQFRLTHMVYLAVAVGDGTPPWLLHYEWVQQPAGMEFTKPLLPYGERVKELIRSGLDTDLQKAEFCKARVRELDAHFGIQQQNSMKDAAHEPGLVRDWAAEDAVWARPGPGKHPVWFAYGLLIGDDRPSYRWTHPGRKDTWERFKQFQWHKVPTIKNGKRVLVDVHHRIWSNPSIKEIAERWRDGHGAPKLQIHDQFLQQSGRDSLWDQLTSERKIPWKNHPGKMHYNNEGRPNHAWDAWCMIMVRMDECGYLNNFGPPPEDDKPD